MHGVAFAGNQSFIIAQTQDLACNAQGITAADADNANASLACRGRDGGNGIGYTFILVHNSWEASATIKMEPVIKITSWGWASTMALCRASLISGIISTGLLPK